MVFLNFICTVDQNLIAKQPIWRNKAICPVIYVLHLNGTLNVACTQTQTQSHTHSDLLCLYIHCTRVPAKQTNQNAAVDLRPAAVAQVTCLLECHCNLEDMEAVYFRDSAPLPSVCNSSTQHVWSLSHPSHLHSTNTKQRLQSLLSWCSSWVKIDNIHNVLSLFNPVCLTSLYMLFSTIQWQSKNFHP